MFIHSTRSTQHSLKLLSAHISRNNFDRLKFPLATQKRTRGKFNPSARGCGIFYIAKKRNQR
jgi:hypothetical protein